MKNLEIDFLGYKFKNPIIAASGVFGYGEEYKAFYNIEDLGGISLKGLTLRPQEGNKGPRIAETASGLINSVGLQNPGVEVFKSKYNEELKKLNTIKIGNLAGHSFKEYVEIVKEMNDSAIDLIELNISCPNVSEGGMAFGVDPKNVYKITSEVKKVAKKPVIIKLTPNVSKIQDNAKAAEDGGADSISLINTIEAMAIDYKTRRPILYRGKGGLSGPCVKPIALRMVWDVYNTVKIPIIGMGGIESYTDVLEFMICGATLVQVGSANLYKPTASKDIICDLENYFLKNKENIKDYIGSLKVWG